MVYETRIPTAVGVARGFKAMASPTAKLKGLKTRLCLIRFVGEASTLTPRSTPTKASMSKRKTLPFAK